MAGQRQIQITEVPARRGQVLSFVIVTPGQYTPLFVAERDMVIDDARLRYGTTNGGAMTATIAKAASGTALSSATNITETGTGVVNMNTTANTNYAFTMDDLGTLNTKVPAENVVAAGSTVSLNLSTTRTNLANVVVTLRVSDLKMV